MSWDGMSNREAWEVKEGERGGCSKLSDSGVSLPNHGSFCVDTGGEIEAGLEL